MNKIVFVQRELEDKLGPMTIVGHLKSLGFSAKILVDPEKNIAKLREIGPDFIAFSLCSPSLDWTLKACRLIKDALPKALTILGGPHPTYFPQVIEQDGVDIVCLGEGERAVAEIMKRYDGTRISIKDISNLWVKDDRTIYKNALGQLLTEDELSALPPCDRSHYADYPALRKNPHKKIWTSRGCPFNCSYCFNHAYNKMYKGLGKIVRRRSVESVINELKQLKIFGWNTLEITDDQFCLDPDWVKNFCCRYEQEIGLPFTCFSTANVIKRDVVSALKKAGCKVVSFGIESGVERIRKEIYEKAISDRDIFQAAEVLHSCGMPFLTFNMVGLPDETLEDMYATIKMNQDIRTTYPWCSIIHPYPGTKIAEYWKDKNCGEISEFSYSFFQDSPLKNADLNRVISNTQKLFSHLVKSRTSYDRFVRQVKYPRYGESRFYPLIFYWHYGRDVRKRYGMSWMTLLRYWLYAH